MARLIYSLLHAVLIGVSGVLANVEKTIFLGPSPIEVPSQHPTLSQLKLQSLTPNHPSLRTSLNVQFPTKELPDGLSSWFMLEGLTAGQRYEVRICWSATQPTAFSLVTHEVPYVFATPEHITSLSNYSYAQQSTSSSVSQNTPQDGTPQAILLLQILTAADYYTLNKTLMAQPLPVLVDIILDPFMLNIFPRSLVPTAGYLLGVAVVAWWISSLAIKWLKAIVTEGNEVVDQVADMKKKI